MSARASFFVVSRLNGREQPSLYWDELPRQPIRNLVYVVRLDELPNGEAMCKASLDQLYNVFCTLRRRGTLPPRWQPPPRKTDTGPAKLKPGHREYHARRFMPDAPYEEPIVSPQAPDVGQPVQQGRVY